MRRYETSTSEETKEIGRALAAEAHPGDVVALVGDLGAGKTTMAKGFAEGLGVTEPITSPTFTIVCEYDEGRLPFYHFDVYRLDDPEELFEIGFEEYINGGGVCLIEWADRIKEELPAETTVISIRRTDVGDGRIVLVGRMSDFD